MRETGKTRLGTAKSRETLKGSCGVSNTEDGTTKVAVATGDAPVAECRERFARALIARGVTPSDAARTARRVVKLASSRLPARTAAHQARCITRQALQAVAS